MLHPSPELEASMRAVYHSDSHHHGESVWDHTQEVLGDVLAVYPGSELLATVALWHDAGKPTTITVLEYGRMAFHGHAAESARLAREAGVSEDACLLIEHHHDLINMVNNAKNGSVSNAAKRLAASRLVELGLFSHLVAFTLLDAKRNVDYDNTSAALMVMAAEVMTAIRKLDAKRVRAARIEAAELIRLPEAKALLINAGFPEVAEALPDYKQARKLLGQAKAYSIIKSLGELLDDQTRRAH